MNSSAVVLVRAVALAVFVLFDVHADDHRPGERERPRTLMVDVRWLDRVPFAAERQLVERAVDAWAKRIVSYGAPAGLSVPGPVYLVYPPYTGVDQPHMPMQRTLIHGGVALYPDVDLVLLVDDSLSNSISTGHPHGWTIHADTGAFQPWLGVISLSPNGRFDFRTLVHEIGHVLGIGTAPVYRRFVTRDERGNPVDFVGPHTLSYYGQPVPIEDGHIAPCPSVMSYRECSAETPSELDWAVLRDLGYRVLR